MSRISSKQVEVLRNAMEAELAKLVIETQDEMNPELKLTTSILTVMLLMMRLLPTS